MTQTATEWLEDCFKRYGTLLKSDFIKTKQMERQQQGYSIDDLKEAYSIGRNNNTIKAFNEQFKNK